MQQKPPKPLIVGILAALGAGLITIFLLRKKAEEKEKPSKKAPQLDLDNPGSQDEFPKAPIESEIG